MNQDQNTNTFIHNIMEDFQQDLSGNPRLLLLNNLINIIQGKFIIPELLQSKSNKDNIMYYLKKFLEDNDYLQEVLSNASEATAKLKSQSTPSIMAAEKIIQIVNEK